MKMRWLPGLALCCLVFVPAVARPAPAVEDKSARPGIVLRVQAIDELLANGRYLAGLVDQEEYAKQLEGFLKSMAGPDGLKGIDTKRPIGLYGNIGPNGIDSTVVMLVPIVDEKAVLDVLNQFQIKFDKDKDGLYTVKDDNLPVPVYFRFANKHAYITVQDESSIAKDKLLTPEKVFPPGPTPVIAASVNVAAIPEDLRNLAIAEFEKNLDDAKKMREPNETDAQFKIKGLTIDVLGEQILALLKDGDNITLSFNIDRKKGDISLDLDLAGKGRSNLGTTIAGLATVKSVVAGLISKDSTMNMVLYAAIPDAHRKTLGPIVDDLVKEALAGEQDPAQRKLAEKIFRAVEPTLKAAELDVAMDMRGPSAKNLYTVVAGAKIKDGAAIERALRDLIKELPPDQKALIRLDVDTVGAVKIHQVEAQKTFDDETRKSFGDNPVYVAVRNDAVFITAGENGLAAIKAAVVAPPRATMPLKMEISMARLARAMALQTPDAPKIAAEVFGKNPTDDKVILSIEGGDSLRLRFGTKAQVITFLGKVGQAQAGAP